MRRAVSGLLSLFCVFVFMVSLPVSSFGQEIDDEEAKTGKKAYIPSRSSLEIEENINDAKGISPETSAIYAGYADPSEVFRYRRFHVLRYYTLQHKKLFLSVTDTGWTVREFGYFTLEEQGKSDMAKNSLTSTSLAIGGIFYNEHTRTWTRRGADVLYMELKPSRDWSQDLKDKTQEEAERWLNHITNLLNDKTYTGYGEGLNYSFIHSIMQGGTPTDILLGTDSTKVNSAALVTSTAEISAKTFVDLENSEWLVDGVNDEFKKWREKYIVPYVMNVLVKATVNTYRVETSGENFPLTAVAGDTYSEFFNNLRFKFVYDGTYSPILGKVDIDKYVELTEEELAKLVEKCLKQQNATKPYAFATNYFVTMWSEKLALLKDFAVQEEGFEAITIEGKTYAPVTAAVKLYPLVTPTVYKQVSEGVYTGLDTETEGSNTVLGSTLETSGAGGVLHIDITNLRMYSNPKESEVYFSEQIDEAFKLGASGYWFCSAILDGDVEGAKPAVLQMRILEGLEYRVKEKSEESGKKVYVTKDTVTGRLLEIGGNKVYPFQVNASSAKYINAQNSTKLAFYGQNDTVLGEDLIPNIKFIKGKGVLILGSTKAVEPTGLLSYWGSADGKRTAERLGVDVETVIEEINSVLKLERGLDYDDMNKLGEIKLMLETGKARAILKPLFLINFMAGIVVIVLGVVLVLAYLADKIGLAPISLLPKVTFGRFHSNRLGNTGLGDEKELKPLGLLGIFLMLLSFGVLLFNSKALAATFVYLYYEIIGG